MSKKASPSPLICTQPFEWLEIHPGGHAFACCPGWLSLPLGNLLHTSLAALWNGSNARNLRTSVLDGSFRHCRRDRCPRLAGRTPPVMPLADLEPGEVAEALKDRCTVLPFGPRRLNLCFDRSCNLACPSCRRTFTTANEIERREARQLLDTIRREAAPNVVELTMSGFGDPFASPSYRTLLEEFRPEDFPRLERLHLHSNGQLWDEGTWHSLPAVHPFVRTAEISVDAACAATYAVNRPGGDFGRLLANLAFLQTLPLSATLSFVVQSNNFREIPAFVELGRRFGCALYFSRLVNWGTFSGEEYRQRAVHLPDHPEHADLLQTLERVAGAPGVDLGNLAPLLTGGVQERNSR